MPAKGAIVTLPSDQQKIWWMLANHDTKSCVGIKIVLPRQGHFGKMCQHLAVVATCRQHVGNFLSQAQERQIAQEQRIAREQQIAQRQQRRGGKGDQICINSYNEVYSVYIRGSPIQNFGNGTDLKLGTTKERPRGRVSTGTIFGA